jgi:hypothetical protein
MFVERTLVGKIYYSLKHALFNMGMPSSSITDLKFRIREGFVNEFNEERKNEELVGPLEIHVRHTFDNLTEVPQIAGKKFVFAHINNWEYAAHETTSYTDILQSANQVIESTVRKIITGSQVAPVVVLLSDHGIVPSLEAVKRKRSVFEKYIHYPNKSLDQEYIDACWYTVNNIEAFFLPAGGNTSVYPNMTPVNAWRMILNYYFGTDIPRTEDKSYYWSFYEEYCELNGSDQKLTCT